MDDRIDRIKEWASSRSWFNTEVVDGIADFLGSGGEITQDQDEALDNIINGFNIPDLVRIDPWTEFKEQAIEARPLLAMWLDAVAHHEFTGGCLKIFFNEDQRIYSDSLRRHTESLETLLKKVMGRECGLIIYPFDAKPMLSEAIQSTPRTADIEIEPHGWEYCLEEIEDILFEKSNIFERYKHLDVAAALTYLSVSQEWKALNPEKMDEWLGGHEWNSAMDYAEALAQGRRNNCEA